MSNMINKQATKRDIAILIISTLSVFLGGYEIGQMVSISRFLTVDSSSAEIMKNVDFIHQHLMILLGIIFFSTGFALLFFYKNRHESSK